MGSQGWATLPYRQQQWHLMCFACYQIFDWWLHPRYWIQSYVNLDEVFHSRNILLALSLICLRSAMTLGRSQTCWFWLENARVTLATAGIVSELKGQFQKGSRWHWSFPARAIVVIYFLIPSTSNDYLAGTVLATGHTVVSKIWFLTLKIIHYYSPIVEAVYDHNVTDCPTSEATQVKREGKESDDDPRLEVLYLKSPLKPWAEAGFCFSWHSDRQIWNQQLAVIIVVNPV